MIHFFYFDLEVVNKNMTRYVVSNRNSFNAREWLRGCVDEAKNDDNFIIKPKGNSDYHYRNFIYHIFYLEMVKNSCYERSNMLSDNIIRKLMRKWFLDLCFVSPVLSHPFCSNPEKVEIAVESCINWILGRKKL